MVNNGQAYVEACRSFSSSVRELAGHFHENEIVEVSEGRGKKERRWGRRDGDRRGEGKKGGGRRRGDRGGGMGVRRGEGRGGRVEKGGG